MCNYIFTYLSTVIFLLVKLIWRYRRDLRDYCTQFYTQSPTYVLTAAVQYTGLEPLYNNSSWNGGYFYSDMTEDGLMVI